MIDRMVTVHHVWLDTSYRRDSAYSLPYMMSIVYGIQVLTVLDARKDIIYRISGAMRWMGIVLISITRGRCVGVAREVRWHQVVSAYDSELIRFLNMIQVFKFYYI